MSARLEIEGLNAGYEGESVLDDLQLELPAGAYGVVLGMSGAGKSTLLRAIAGLVPAEGIIRLGERVLSAPRSVIPPEERELGYLFQGLALWPHMTVRQHLRFVLPARGRSAHERDERIADVLGALGLETLAGRVPSELSGGERQRLALARALVQRPGLLLLDEPTSSLDPIRAAEVRALLRSINRDFHASVLHVTHDQDEAFELGERIYVLGRGRILQAGTPRELWERPRGVEIARFLGAGSILPGTVEADGVASTPLGRVPLSGSAPDPGPVWLLLRPDAVGPVDAGEGVVAEVEGAAFRGGHYLVTARLGEHAIVLEHGDGLAMGTEIRLAPRAPAVVVERRSAS